MNEEELNELKYRQLQKLAKDHGIKANMPKAALIAALLEVDQTSAEKGANPEDKGEDSTDASTDEDLHLHLDETPKETSRRNPSKRKARNANESDTAEEVDTSLKNSNSANKSVNVEEENSSRRNSRKRKSSTANKSTNIEEPKESSSSQQS